MKGTLALLALAEVADLATTWFGATHGGHEANPYSVAAVAMFGVVGVAIVKLGTVPAVAGLGYIAPSERSRAIFCKGVRIAATMLLGVAASNVLVGL